MPNRPYRYHLGAGAANEPPLLPPLPAPMTTRGYAPNVRRQGLGLRPDWARPRATAPTESWIVQRCRTE